MGRIGDIFRLRYPPFHSGRGRPRESFRFMSVSKLFAASVICAGLAGCKSTQQALGMTKVTPDEFRVVTKAPHNKPPDYALRPPAPGKPRPQELQPESAARLALQGQRDAEARSPDEKLLANKVVF